MSTKIAGIYLLVQSVAGLLWWIMLFGYPPSRRLFVPEQFPDQVLTSLVVADVLLFVTGSGIAGWAVLRRWPVAALICTFVLGATAYATLICWGWLIASGQVAISAGLMTAALAGTGLATWGSLRK